MATTALTLDEIYALAHGAMTANGCNDENASALADIVTRAERDGSHSHGLFRIPGYVKALRSGKVDGKASPTVTRVTPAVIRCEGMAALRRWPRQTRCRCLPRPRPRLVWRRFR